MKIPTEIKLFGVTYPIVQSENIMGDNKGLMAWSVGRIHLDKTLKDDDKLLVLWHEITHLILGNSGFQEVRTNESFVEVFSNLLLDFVLQLENKDYKINDGDYLIIASMKHKIKFIEFENEFKHGETDYYEQIIEINKEINDNFKFFVILHEYIHLILDYIGEHSLSGDEVFVDRMTTFIHEILQKNFINGDI